MEKELTNVFVLSEDGTYLEAESIYMLLGPIEKRYEIANIPEMNHVMMKAADERGKNVKNAHNSPDYLLDAIMTSEHMPIVIAWNTADDGRLLPRYLAGDYEINCLIEGLKNNPNVDAWETAIKVANKIRSEE